MSEGPAPQPFGQVYDRGYKSYAGERLGSGYIVRRLAGYSAKRALGARKSWTAKVMPILLYVAIGLIIAIPVGIVAFASAVDVLPYWDYFGFIFAIEVIFVATIAPELLCSDRRDNVLPLYFSRSMHRWHYVAAKAISAFGLLLTVTLLPPVIYWLFRQLLDDQPLRAIADNAGDLARIVVIGIALAYYMGSLGLAIASTTKRTAIAVGGIIVGLFLLNPIAVGLATAIDQDPWQRLFVFLSPMGMVQQLAYGIFDETSDDHTFGEPFAWWVYLIVMLLVGLLANAFTFWRYRKDV